MRVKGKKKIWTQLVSDSECDLGKDRHNVTARETIFYLKGLKNLDRNLFKMYPE